MYSKKIPSTECEKKIFFVEIFLESRLHNSVEGKDCVETSRLYILIILLTRGERKSFDDKNEMRRVHLNSLVYIVSKKISFAD